MIARWVDCTSDCEVEAIGMQARGTATRQSLRSQPPPGQADNRATSFRRKVAADLGQARLWAAGLQAGGLGRESVELDALDGDKTLENCREN